MHMERPTLMRVKKTEVDNWRKRVFNPEHYRTPLVQPLRVSKSAGVTRVTMPIPEYTNDVPCRQVDPEMFFTDRGGEGYENVMATACAMCEGCDLLVECREWGIASFEYGVIGGLTAQERSRVRKIRGWSLSLDHIKLIDGA